MSGALAGGLTLSEERCHLGEIAPGEPLFESHAFLVRGESADGVDVTLWASPYILRRLGAAYDMQLTVLIAGRWDSGERQVMHDNEFVAMGWHPSEQLPRGAVRAEERNGRVVWTAPGRLYEDAPPEWTVRGEHGGVDLDLHFVAHAPVFALRPHERFAADGAAWFEQGLTADGLVGFAGDRIEISGYACHERAISTAEGSPAMARGDGMILQTLLADRVQAMVLAVPSGGVTHAFVAVDGELHRAQGGAVVVEQLERWLDPRSRIELPTAFRVEVRTEGGALDLVLRSYARAYYPLIRDTVNVLYWMAAEASGAFTRADGEVVSFERAKCVLHSNRVLFEPSA